MEHDRDPVISRIMQMDSDHPNRGLEEEEEWQVERDDLLEFLKGGRQNRRNSGYSAAVRRRLANCTKKKLQKIFACKTSGLRRYI